MSQERSGLAVTGIALTIGIISSVLLYMLILHEFPMVNLYVATQQQVLNLDADPLGFLLMFGALAYLDAYLIYLLCHPPRSCALRQQQRDLLG